MSVEAQILDIVKQHLGVESDAQLGITLGIGRDSLSGIRTGRLPMGESIRFVLLQAWWNARQGRGVHDESHEFAAQTLAAQVQVRLKAGTHEDEAVVQDASEFSSADAVLLEMYKRYKQSRTDQEVAQWLGIKRHSLSMVRSGRNRLGPVPLLRIYTEIHQAQHLGLEEAVGSSAGLLRLLQTQDSRPATESAG